MLLSWGAGSHTGNRRKTNEDAYLAGDGVFLVADGMGGHDAGDVASSAALNVLGALRSIEHTAPEQVVDLFRRAQEDVRAIDTGSDGRGAGTTLTGALAVELDAVPYWLFVNLGDSRTYLLSGGAFDQVSVDHSEVQELVDAGAITAEEARRHPRRNVVTRALGADGPPEPDFRYVPMSAGDRVLVCSDGLTGELTDERIATVLGACAEPQEAADVLVAEAVRAGGRDNITVVVIDVMGDSAWDGDVDTMPRSLADLDEDTVPTTAAGGTA